MSAKTDYPLVERGAPQWEAMVDEIDALRQVNSAFASQAAHARFPALLGKGDSFHDVSTGGLWEVASVEAGVVWVPVDLDTKPDPDSCPSVYLAGKSGMIHTSTHGWVNVVNPPTQEVTMKPITDTRFRVRAIDIDSDDPTLAKVGISDVDNCWGDKYPASATFRVPIEMAPRIGEVITMSWGASL